MDKNYTATIDFTTQENPTVKDKIQIKNFSGARSLNDYVPTDGDFELKLTRYSVVQVHNENARDDKDYRVAVLETVEDGVFRTSSTPFMESVAAIIDELNEGGEKLTDYTLVVYKLKSKNEQGYLLQATIR